MTIVSVQNAMNLEPGAEDWVAEKISQSSSPSPIKVLHIFNFPYLGGATGSTIAISKYSSQFDPAIEHSILSLKPGISSVVQNAEKNGIKVIVASNTLERDKLIAQADIIHVHYWNNSEILTFLHEELPPTRLIVWFHIAGDKAPHVITRDLVNLADIAIPCNPYSYNLPVFEKLNPEIRHRKVRMVYDAADFDRLQGFSPKPHDTFNVGYIGSLSFVKMHPHYIAMSAGAKIPNVKFILCGLEHHNILREQTQYFNAADRFEFRGYIEDIADAISEFDVYGYPLREDTYAAAELNLQEVMYAGIPPVVFPYGGIRSLVINNYTGLVVNTEQEYTQALEYLYHHPEERLRLGQNAKHYAAQIFGAENAAKQINPIYHQLMESPKRRRSWSIPVDGQLLDEPISLLDIIDIPERFSATKLFIESLGHTANNFITSLISEDLEELTSADHNIAESSFLLAFGQGGIQQYSDSYPNDGYLSFWSGLIHDRSGNKEFALEQLIRATQQGCDHFRVFWYLAQLADHLDRLDIVQQALDHLKTVAPDFIPALNMEKDLQEKLKQYHDRQDNQDHLNLSEINYWIVPDWSAEEDLLIVDLMRVIQTLSQDHDRAITLLIDVTGTTEEEANLVLSSAAMNLMLEAELEPGENLNICFLTEMDFSKWGMLLPQILARIQLEYENRDCLEKAESLPILSATNPNYLIHLDWNQDQTELDQVLGQLLKDLAQQDENDGACVLIDIKDLDAETIGLYLSEVVMNLFLEEGIDVNDRLSLSFVRNLSSHQLNHLKMTTKIFHLGY